MRWHCPPDTRFKIRALAVWGRARYLSVMEAPHNTEFYTWVGKKHFCFFQTAETGNRTPWKETVLTTNVGPPPERTRQAKFWLNLKWWLTIFYLLCVRIISEKWMLACIHFLLIICTPQGCRLPLYPYWLNPHSKQYRFCKKNPSVLLPRNPRRRFSWGCMVIVLKGSF